MLQCIAKRFDGYVLAYVAAVLEAVGNCFRDALDRHLDSFDLDVLDPRRRRGSAQSSGRGRRRRKRGPLARGPRPGAPWPIGPCPANGDTIVSKLLQNVDQQRWWSLSRDFQLNQVSQMGEEIEATYWRRAPVFWMSEDGADIAYAIRMLISVGRARQALPLAGRGNKVHLSSDLLVEVLKESTRQPVENNDDSNEATMVQHYVAEIPQILDGHDDFDRNAMVGMNYGGLSKPILRHRKTGAKHVQSAMKGNEVQV